MTPEINLEKLNYIIEQVLEEDIRSGDLTTRMLISTDTEAKAYIISNQSGIIAGLPVLEQIYKGLKLKKNVEEGGAVDKGTEIIEIEGPAVTILSRERTALNFLSHLSGVSTLTRKFVDRVKDYNAAILDTRKTIPGLRLLEKYAVRVGGAENHRFGLYDQILIKDNHLKILQRLGPDFIYRAIKAFRNTDKKIEIEVQTVEQAQEAVETGADILLLDNMTIADIKDIVRQFKDRVILEVSGGVTLDNVTEIAQAGVDYISIGAITHSAPGMDLSMEIE